MPAIRRVGSDRSGAQPPPTAARTESGWLESLTYPDWTERFGTPLPVLEFGTCFRGAFESGYHQCHRLGRSDRGPPESCDDPEHRGSADHEAQEASRPHLFFPRPHRRGGRAPRGHPTDPRRRPGLQGEALRPVARPSRPRRVLLFSTAERRRRRLPALSEDAARPWSGAASSSTPRRGIPRSQRRPEIQRARPIPSNGSSRSCKSSPGRGTRRSMEVSLIPGINASGADQAAIINAVSRGLPGGGRQRGRSSGGADRFEQLKKIRESVRDHRPEEAFGAPGALRVRRGRRSVTWNGAVLPRLYRGPPDPAGPAPAGSGRSGDPPRAAEEARGGRDRCAPERGGREGDRRARGAARRRPAPARRCSMRNWSGWPLGDDSRIGRHRTLDATGEWRTGSPRWRRPPTSVGAEVEALE